MRRLLPAILLTALLVGLEGCNDEVAETPPPPFEMTADAVGHYCNMNLSEHAGPKGQIILESRAGPVWFTSARDTLAFTMLPEESKDIRAVYVSDMGKALDWSQPGANNWVEARQAFFVIESNAKGGMGAAEAVPFSSRSEAEKFALAHGGKVVTFEQVPRDYILG
jgi:copper chaperone NosL